MAHIELDLEKLITDNVISYMLIKHLYYMKIIKLFSLKDSQKDTLTFDLGTFPRRVMFF